METQDAPPPYPATEGESMGPLIFQTPQPNTTTETTYQIQPGLSEQPSDAPPAYSPQVYLHQQEYNPVANAYPEKGIANATFNYGESATAVIVSQPVPVAMIREGQEVRPSPAGAIIFSCFVFWCCCWPLGCAAFVFAMIACSANNAANMERQLSISKKISLVGMACGLMILIISIIYEVMNVNNTYG